VKRRNAGTIRLLALVVLVLVAAGLPSCVSDVAPTSTPMPTPTCTPDPPGDGVVRGWAVLAEKDDYQDVQMTDLPIDYVNVTLLRQQLLAAGWPESHIRELREFDADGIRQGLGWLAANADEDDVAFFYVFAHGRYLRQVVEWGEFFAADWTEVRSERRVLVVDACQAELLTDAVKDDPRPHLSIAAVNKDEFGWAGLEEEGLPIIGAVFTHYFAAALGDASRTADADGNGRVSLQEAARQADAQQRAYMHDVILKVPEFVEMYHKIGYYPERDPGFPHVVVDDAIGAPTYLELDAP